MVSFLTPTDIITKQAIKMKIHYKEDVNLKEKSKLNMVKRVIEEFFKSAGIINHEGDMYIGNGDANDYVAFGKVAIGLMSDVRLLSYIDDWLYYDEYGNICDCGSMSKKDAGLLPPDAPDKTMYNEKKLSTMKMEIHYREATNPKDQRSLDNLIRVVDELFKRCGIPNKEKEHVYVGNGDVHDYERFGMVFSELYDWKAFLKYVDVWNFYNEYSEAENFLTLNSQKVAAL